MLRRWPWVDVQRRGWGELAAFALYALIAFFFFGLRLLLRDGSNYVGVGVDPEIFIWSFAWWPHAIAHGLNPIVTHAIWAPDGVNLAWTTTVPGLALLFSPLTVAAGAVASYDVAAVAMPALAATSAFLLCRHMTHRLWPSLVGGYLFGFSSYMLGQEEGHLHATSVFLVPLVALAVLRYVEEEIGGRRLTVELGVLLALQLLFSTEVLFTLTLALACALATAFVIVPQRRRVLRALVPIAASYALAALLTAPFVYYLLTDFQTRAFHPPHDYNTDLLNFVVPTQLVLAAHGWAGSIASNFPGNDSERGGYLGWPALVIVALYAWSRLRAPGGRFLVVSLLIAALASLGATLIVRGERLHPLPWEHVGYLPLFDNVLVERLTLYVGLAVAVMVSLWTASQRRAVLRWLLPALAIVAIVPNPAAPAWASTFTLPRFFTDRAYRSCLAAGENILPLPVGDRGYADLWQTVTGFHFRMAGGYVFSGPPASFQAPPAVDYVSHGNPLAADQAALLRTYIEGKHVTSVVVDQSMSDQWAGALDRIAARHRVAGVLLYHLGRSPARCPRG